MVKILLKSVLLTTFFLLLPATAFASDLEITCYQDQKPTVNTSTTPLFQLSNLLPGDNITKSVEVVNTDNVNPCIIAIQGSGDSNILTDNIQFTIDSLYSKTLSDFIDGDSIQIANLAPDESVARTITLYFPPTSNNLLANKSATFDLKINSQWGDEQNRDVLGEDTKTTNTEGQGSDNDIIPENNNESPQDVLGTTEDTQDVCNEKTLWWIPLVVQILLTLFILPSKRLYLGNSFVKLFIAVILGILAFFIAKQIGCGCNILLLCKYSWILNILFGISPIPPMIKKFIKG